MTDIALTKLYIIIWDWRRKYQKWFPTPDRLTSMRYAASEAGEFLSELIRREHSDHNRNRDKQPEPEVEAADTVFMLLTALGDGFIPWQQEAVECNEDRAAMFVFYAYQVTFSENGTEIWDKVVGNRAIYTAALAMMQFTSEEVVEAKLEKIYQKRILPIMEAESGTKTS